MNTATVVPNLHVLIIKNIMETNNRAARVKIISERFKQFVYIPFTNEPGASTPSLDSAKIWLIRNGHNIIGQAMSKYCYYLICAADEFGSFKPLKK